MNTTDYTIPVNNCAKFTVELVVSQAFKYVHSEFKVKSGDITPEQEERLSLIKKQLSELIAEQVLQNL